MEWNDMKICPVCWSTDVTIKIPQMNLWVCKECGWEGTEILEFPDLPKETLKKMKRIREMERLGKEEEASRLRKELEEEIE